MATPADFTMTTTPLNSSNLITPTPQGEIPMPFHAAVVVLLSIISAMGIIGNLFIIGSVCLYKRLRVRGHAFIINLALADLLVVAYTMPAGLATSQLVKNPFSEMMCDINAFLLITSLGVSSQTLMMIALERYFHICKMHLYRKAFTPRLIGVYIFVIWIYTVAWTCHGWTGWTEYIYGEFIFLCTFDGHMSFSYNVCLSIFGIFLPMIVVAVCYYKIFRTVVRSRRAISAHKNKATKKQPTSAAERLHKPEVEKQAEREYRLIITLFTIVIIFICCWLPACVFLAIASFFPGMPKVINKLGMWLALSNSAVNSVLYGLLNHQFRKGYRIVFETVFCCGHMPKAWCKTTKKKESTSGSQSRSPNTKQSKWSGSPSSQSDSSNPKSGASTDTKDITIADSRQNLSSPIQSTSNLASKPPTLTPIQYIEEPESGAPIGKPNGTHMNIDNCSMPQADRVATVHVSDYQVTPLTLSGSYHKGGGVNSTAQRDSQSSLLQESQAGSEAGSVDKGIYIAASHQSAETTWAQRNHGQIVNRTHPPPSAFRPRPTSTRRLMSNVVLETKF